MKATIRCIIFWLYARGGDILRRLYPEMAQVRVDLVHVPGWPESIPYRTCVGWRDHEAYQEAYHEDSHRTECRMKKPSVENLTWQDVLDCRVKWGAIFGARGLAETAGYPYFVWDGKVYQTSSLTDTGFLTANIK